MAPEVKSAKNSKLPKMSEKCFEPVGKGGWPPISIWINQSPSFDNIVSAMSDILYDQTIYAKVCSSHHYEKQKLMENMMTQSCQIST